MITYINPSHYETAQGLSLASESIKREMLKMKKVYAEEFYNFGEDISNFSCF